MSRVGIDLGSRYVKAAVLRDEHVKLLRWDTAEFYRSFVKRRGGELYIELAAAGLPDDTAITATGYGRNLMSFANANVISEIKAHFRGALEATGESDFILVDVGGQDSKVIYVKDGYIEDFVMNDKCAASTGRFLENACSILHVSLDELSAMKDKPVKLSSTCAIFSESEIIGKIAEGCTTEEIGAGVNESIARRLLPLIKRFRAPRIYAAGGVAANGALFSMLSDMVDKEIDILPESQYNGCRGCLFY
ncbi:acyl-CoA dehydratase activase [Limisalsivibrio acetivorans]|uniref:acyl-CoA dehydratase activase n=1 Tax=Limisalsivibrio acetivorans TaxID=1304888 RepID=UPI0003B538A3|nr:acyl-CoA dehydratase activase [Limisalsivibrio acetivorans]